MLRFVFGPKLIVQNFSWIGACAYKLQQFCRACKKKKTLIVRWLSEIIVTEWIKAPNFWEACLGFTY